jgi:hypothetical protein
MMSDDNTFAHRLVQAAPALEELEGHIETAADVEEVVALLDYVLR